MPQSLVDVVDFFLRIAGGLGLRTPASLAIANMLSNGILTLACFGVAFGILWYSHHHKGLAAAYRKVTSLICVFALACGTGQLLDLLTFWFPATSGLFSLANVGVGAVALIAAFALWPRLPKLVTLPSAADLLEANQRLAADELARRKLVETLSSFNHALEQRVAARTQELAEATRRFEAALASSNISMAQQDRELRYTWVHNPPADQKIADMIGARPEDIFPAPTAQITAAAKRRVLETGTATRMEIALPHAGKILWFDERIEPIYADGEIVGVTTVAIDVTSHKLYEQHLQNLLRELSHRSKNLLAIVQGIARQTGGSVTNLPDYLARFSARLQALSGAHELLVNRSWHGVDLRDLVLREIGQDPARLEERLSIVGETTIVGPEAAQNIALGLHEMASNAYRYGALQSAHGRIAIAWQQIVVEDRPLVELTWVESNGPSVEPPTHAGFGRALLERLVARALEGTSDLMFAPEGVRWTLRFPVSRLGETEG
jgi:PAS domain S-box-containing protein